MKEIFIGLMLLFNLGLVTLFTWAVISWGNAQQLIRNQKEVARNKPKA